VHYQYSDNFYAGLMHLIGPWYRGSFRWLERSLAATLDLVSFGAEGLYRLAQPTLLMLAAAVAMLAWVL
jgi:NADH-quinone oxidoreductase subunit M